MVGNNENRLLIYIYIYIYIYMISIYDLLNFISSFLYIF